jgi:hypothetical protein
MRIIGSRMAVSDQSPGPGDEAREKFQRATRLFELANSEDPNRVLDAAVERPREVVDAERLVRWVMRLEPDASEALHLAAHCQHLERWRIPRSSYPEGRTGYLLWRKELGRFHAERSGEILRSVGYDDATIERVRNINLKKALKLDADVQAMEDALCLSFLEHEIDEFAAKHADDKVVDILGKTWRKMSDRGHAEARRLRYSDRIAALVEKALAGACSP